MLESEKAGSWAFLVGRVLLVVVFLVSGVGKIPGFQGTSQFMAAQGMPMVGALLLLAIVIEIGASALIVAGYQTRWAALALVAFTVVATVIFHQFWAAPAEQAQLQTIMFPKNVGLIGGLLFLAAAGPGPLSVEGRRRQE